MNPRHRDTARLTLGFLTLGAQAAPLDTVHAAAEAGYGAAGPRISGRYPGDAWPAVDGVPAAFEAIRETALARGVRISSVSGYYLSPQVQPSHLRANVDAARAVGAPMILQGCFDDHARMAALLRDYAGAAAGANIRIALEFMPMSGLKNLHQTLALIDACGAPNVGILVDTLHLARSGATAADLAALDASRIYLTQLCDAPARLPADSSLFDEAMSGRMYLGDGQLDLAAVVRAQAPDAELELETPVVPDARLPSAERARKAADAAQRFFDRHFAA
jgi:sugar phosphate isomerase/epimerase